MIIETLTWGTLEMSEDQVYRFDKGIPGFEAETEFALIINDEGPFSYLQSVKDPNLSFLLTDPFVFYSSYEFELPASDKEELGISSEVIIRCMVTVRADLEHTTMNLLAPIVLNPLKQRGKQTVLHKSAYSTQHLLWNTSQAEIRKGGE